jgi:diacylglycerol kinase family enzyme
LAITADGEPLYMKTPITYEIMPRALKILAPAPPPPEPRHAPDRASV